MARPVERPSQGAHARPSCASRRRLASVGYRSTFGAYSPSRFFTAERSTNLPGHPSIWARGDHRKMKKIARTLLASLAVLGVLAAVPAIASADELAPNTVVVAPGTTVVVDP